MLPNHLYYSHHWDAPPLIEQKQRGGNILTHGHKREIFTHPQSYPVAKLTGCKNFSRARRLAPNLVEALDWECSLTINESIPPDFTRIGIRAHQLIFTELANLKTPDRKLEPTLALSLIDCTKSQLEILDRAPINEISTENTFLCWLVQTSETPHRMTLYLKLHRSPQHLKDYHLQVELFKENWLLLSQFPLAWHIKLDPQQLFLLRDRV